MESRPLGILFACIITQCFAASTTFASLLLVSGDTSIGFAIDGSDGARLVKKLICIAISTSYHLLSMSQCLCILPQKRLRIG